MAHDIAPKFNLAKLPGSVTWNQIIGIGFLTGIGFTMSRFISSLAFSTNASNIEAKFAILLASVISVTIGFRLLLKNSRI